MNHFRHKKELMTIPFGFINLVLVRDMITETLRILNGEQPFAISVGFVGIVFGDTVCIPL